MDRLVEDYRVAGIQTPTVEQVQQRTTKNQESVPQLIALAAASGDLVEITSEYFLHAGVDCQLRETLAPQLSEGQGLTLSEIREILATSGNTPFPIASIWIGSVSRSARAISGHSVRCLDPLT